MEFVPIDLIYKDKIDSYLAARRIESSELTFLSLYIWRKAFNIRFAQVDGCLVLAFRDNDFPPSLRFPLGGGDIKGALYASCKAFMQAGFEPRFYGLTKDMKEELVRLCPNKFEIAPMTDYYDYVYSTERLITLAGRDLHGKRNHVNGFKREYDYKYLPLAGSDANEIKKVYDSWFLQSKGKKSRYLASERESIGDIMDNFDALGCKGAKLYADGELCAFTIGERLNNNTAVIRTEKADKSVRGAYPAINQMFLENQWGDFEYVNREDDFGIPGLRKAKQSYRPAFMVEKYSAIYKGSIEEIYI